MKDVSILVRDLPGKFEADELYCLFENNGHVKIYYDSLAKKDKKYVKESLKERITRTYNKMEHSVQANNYYLNFLKNLEKAEIKFVNHYSFLSTVVNSA